jgi:two-component system response regulator PilR (NtrC family)
MLLSGYRFLIADDDDDLREIFAESLLSMGAEVIGVESGRRGLAVYQENGGNFDAVVSDMRMPDGDGLEFAHGVKKFELEDDRKKSGRSHRPVFVVYSGYNDLTPEKCKAADILAVFPKPISLELLARDVIKLIDAAKAEQAGAA